MKNIWRKKAFWITLAILLPIGLLAYLIVPPYPSIRHKMVVEVQTPDGIVSGDAVRETSYKGRAIIPLYFPLGESKGVTRMKGEAVVVDLGEGRLMFALLSGANDRTSDYTKYLPWSALRCKGPENCLASEDVWPVPILKGYSNRHRRPPGPPILVTFDDLDDPTSVKEVNPDDLAATFGEGYALKRITVQITDEDVTTGIEERLGWLLNPNRKRFEPGAEPDGIPVGDYNGLFSRGIFK